MDAVQLVIAVVCGFLIVVGGLAAFSATGAVDEGVDTEELARRLRQSVTTSHVLLGVPGLVLAVIFLSRGQGPGPGSGVMTNGMGLCCAGGGGGVVLFLTWMFTSTASLWAAGMASRAHRDWVAPVVFTLTSLGAPLVLLQLALQLIQHRR